MKIYITTAILLFTTNLFALELIGVKNGKEYYKHNGKYLVAPKGWYVKHFEAKKKQLAEEEAAKKEEVLADRDMNVNAPIEPILSVEEKRKILREKNLTKNEIALHYNVLTMHFSNPEKVCSEFANQVSKNGCNINNPLYGISFRETIDSAYTQNNFFFGQDSIGSNITGYMHTMGMASDWGIELGLTLGFYFMSNKPWIEKGIKPPAVELSKDYSVIQLQDYS